MTEVLICGYGNIGRYMFEELCPLLDLDVRITIYDPVDKKDEIYCDEKIRFSDEIDEINETRYDFCFICVPTDMLKDGSADTSHVLWALNTVNADVKIIKSTVPPTFIKSIEDREDVVFSPEYWGTTVHSDRPQEFMILGGNRTTCNKVYNLYSRIKDGSFKYIFTTMLTASLSKYMENCWIATKVTFCNDFAELAKHWDVNYEDLRQCFIADSRFSPFHTYAFENQPYYDSHCLNKDIPAIIADIDKINCDYLPLVNSVDKINNKRKKELGL